MGGPAALFLRGVNVGGVTVRSADLRDVLAGVGHPGARTILASGNAVLPNAGDPAAEADRVEAALAERYERSIRSLVVPLPALAAMAAGYPFAEDADHHAYLVFCWDAATLDRVAALAVDDEVEATGAGAGVVYWRAPKGSSVDTAFAKGIARAAVKERTTTRNLTTVRKVLAAGGG